MRLGIERFRPRFAGISFDRNLWMSFKKIGEESGGVGVRDDTSDLPILESF
jgi:hypothetical protein